MTFDEEYKLAFDTYTKSIEEIVEKEVMRLLTMSLTKEEVMVIIRAKIDNMHKKMGV